MRGNSNIFIYLELSSYFSDGGDYVRGPEGKFQSKLKEDIYKTFPEAFIHKTECNERQGAPDLLITYKGRCAYLECKRSADASHRPNQDYYVNKINKDGGFARFIYPENADETMKEMEDWFHAVE